MSKATDSKTGDKPPEEAKSAMKSVVKEAEKSGSSSSSKSKGTKSKGTKTTDAPEGDFTQFRLTH